jgi:hypothetical protein
MPLESHNKEKHSLTLAKLAVQYVLCRRQFESSKTRRDSGQREKEETGTQTVHGI